MGRIKDVQEERVLNFFHSNNLLRVCYGIKFSVST